MKIDIFKHLTVVTKQPAIPMLIPGTPFTLTAYPTRFVLQHLEKATTHEYEIEIEGPVHDFYVRADLERAYFEIEGRTPQTFFRVRVSADDSGIRVLAHKGCKVAGTAVIPCESRGKQRKARLTFGSHTSLNWPELLEREKMEEIIPLLYSATAGYTSQPQEAPSLLRDLQDAIEKRDRVVLFDRVKDIFKCGMAGVFMPAQSDIWGYPVPASTLTPTHFLGTLHGLIQSMFVHEKEGVLSILPALPVEADSGRLIDVKLTNCVVHLEWTKKKLRRLFIDAEKTGKYHLQFTNDQSRFCLKRSKEDAGFQQECGMPLLLEAGNRYYLDHFEN